MNKMHDKVDDILFEYFKQDIDVPPLILNGIKTALKKKKVSKFILIKKAIITIIGFLTIASSVVFADDIYDFIKTYIQNIFGSYNKGITTAVENGYIENITTDYEISNNVKFKINQVLLDDYILGIIIDMVLPSEIDLSNLLSISFNNLLVIDENNNVLLANYDNDDFVKYCNSKNLNLGTYGTGYSSGNINGKVLSVDDSHVIYSLYTSSDRFPNSESITVSFSEILLYNNNIPNSNNNLIAKFNGDWNINVDISNMQSKRENIIYNVTDINDDNTTVVEANLSMSNMRLKLITSSNKIDFNKLHDRTTLSVRDMIPFHDMYIETDDGQKFFKTDSGENGYTTLENGKIEYYVTFDYSYFDLSDNIKIVLPTNNNQEIIIKLKILETQH